MSTIIEVKNLVKHYGKLTAVNGINLSIPQGICFGLLGPNGAGKTTTIEILEGITKPSSGTILYKGSTLDQRYKNEVGIQFQKTALQDFLTVKETLALFARLYKKSIDMAQLIEDCSLGEYLDRDTNKLSGGQRQRLLLALALVHDPEILFLDEPTTGLDPQARRNFWHLVEKIKARNKTIILTTHYMDEAHALCDTLAIMDRGEIIAEGTPKQLLREYFGNTVVQLPRQILDFDYSNLAWQVTPLDNMLEIETKDLQETLKVLLAHNISLEGMTLRSSNLEDLFIKLTGHNLRN